MATTGGVETEARSDTLADDYGAAWNARDVDAILALQTDDMVFRLHIDGFDEVVGGEALLAVFSFCFDALPDCHNLRDPDTAVPNRRRGRHAQRRTDARRRRGCDDQPRGKDQREAHLRRRLRPAPRTQSVTRTDRRPTQPAPRRRSPR